MKKIIITGPEASGKSTLAVALADFFKTSLVPEYARSFLPNLNRPYVEADLLTIAEGQHQAELLQAAKKLDLIICDTSMLVLKVWSDYRFGKTHPWILNRLEENKHALHLLCAPDIPWEADPLRENPHNRDELFEIYRQELITLNHPYVIIKGSKYETRLERAIQAIQSFRV